MYKPSPTDYSKHFDIARTVERASTSGKDTALLCVGWLLFIGSGTKISCLDNQTTDKTGGCQDFL